jgi:hypothetical protein
MKRCTTLYGSWLLCYLLAATLPLISCYSNNYQVFSAHQLWVSAGVLLLVVFLFSTAYFGLSLVAARLLRRLFGKDRAFSDSLFDVFMSIGAAAVYLRLTLYPLTFALTRRLGLAPGVAGILLLFLFALYALIIWRLRWKGTSILLTVLVLWQGAVWVATLRNEQGDSRTIQIPEAERESYRTVQFQTTPNIYFIVLESYHGSDWLREYYGFDNHDFTDELSRMGYSTYSNVFANYYVTVQSLYATFSMNHHFNLQDAGNMDAHGFRPLLSGGEYNPVLSILKQNGYRIEYMLEDTYLYFPELASRHLDALMIEKSNPFHPLATLAWPHRFTDRKAPRYRERLLESLSEKNKPKAPRFVLMKTGVYHLMTPEWPLPSDRWKEDYVGYLEKENQFLIKLCQSIQKQDPGAVVILAGDHGALGYSWGWWERTGTPNAFFEQNGLDPIQVAKDNADVFLAIKLDRPEASPLPVRSLVNLFRELFYSLSDNPQLPATRVPDDSYSPRREGCIHRIVRDGGPLAEFERVETIPDPSAPLRP